MASIREVKKKPRQREWAEEIAECQNSGMNQSEINEGFSEEIRSDREITMRDSVSPIILLSCF